MFKKVLVGCDPRGEKQVDFIVSYLKDRGVEVVVFDSAGCDYVDSAKLCCIEFEKNNAFDALVLVCGTGVGVNIVANRFSFIRAVLGDNAKQVYFARRHEDCNCLCLFAGYSDNHNTLEFDKTKMMECVDAFLDTPFEGGRHFERVKKLSTLGE